MNNSSKTGSRQSFLRDLATLMSGTLLAQAIPILLMPILSRLWTQGDFGLLGTYSAYVAIFGVLATGRFDMALMLPKRDLDASCLLALGFAATIVTSILIFSVLILVQFFTEAGVSPIDEWYFFIPLGVILFGSYTLLIAWNNRVKNYKLMSVGRVAQSASAVTTQLALGSANWMNLGLIFGDLTGRFIAVFILIRSGTISTYLFSTSYVRVRALLRRYARFPKVEAPASLISITARQLPMILLPMIFSAKTAGLYFLVSKVMMVPVSLVGTAVLEIFKNKAQEELITHGNCRTIFLKTSSGLVLVGIGPLIVLVLFAPYLFELIFGAGWREAGEFAQVLAPLALFQFVSAPLSYMLILKEKLAQDLKMQTIYLMMVIFSLSAAFLVKSIYICILSLSISGCLFYLIQVIYSYRLST